MKDTLTDVLIHNENRLNAMDARVGELEHKLRLTEKVLDGLMIVLQSDEPVNVPAWLRRQAD